MTTRSCCVQGSPQLVVLGVDIGPVVEEKLDYLFVVVYAALVRKRCRQIVSFCFLLWEDEGSYLLSCTTVHSEGGEALEQVAQRGCGCPIPGGIEGQAGCGSGQPALVVGDPAQSRGIGTR